MLETLSPEDLERFRPMSATLDLIKARPATLTLTDEEICRFFLDWCMFFLELLDKYEIDGAEAVEAKICPFTGHIYTGAEE